MDKKTQLCGNPILVEYEISRRKKYYTILRDTDYRERLFSTLWKRLN